MIKEYKAGNFWFFIILLHLIFGALAILTGGIYTGDSSEYLFAARNLVDHGRIYAADFSEAVDLKFYSLRPPGYPLLIAVTQILCQSHWFLLLAQNLLSFTVFWGILKWFNQSPFDQIKAYWIIILAVFFPVYFILVNMVMADLLLAVLIFWAVYFWINFFETKSGKSYIYSVCLFTLALLVKPVMMFFWIPLLTISTWLIKPGYKALIISVLILPLVGVAWSWRNFEKTGVWQYSSIETQNILEINAASVVQSIHGLDSAILFRQKILQEASVFPDYAKKAGFIKEKSIEVIRQHPMLYVKAHLIGMLRFFVAPGKVDIDIFFQRADRLEISLLSEIRIYGWLSGIRRYIQAIGVFEFLFLGLLYLGGAIALLLSVIGFFNQKFKKEARWMPAMVVLYVAAACGPGGYARFKVSVWPLMIMLSLMGLEYLMSKVQKTAKD